MYTGIKDIGLSNLIKQGKDKFFFSGVFYNLTFYRNVTSYASKYGYKCKLSSTRIVIDDNNNKPVIAYAVACWFTKKDKQ